MSKKQKKKLEQQWERGWELDKEIAAASGAHGLFVGSVLSSPIPYKHAKKWFGLGPIDEKILNRMVAARINDHDGDTAKLIRYLLKLPRNHKHIKRVLSSLNFKIQRGKDAQERLRRAWDGDKNVFKGTFPL